MNIQVNASEWNEIDAETKSRISAIIASHFPGVSLQPNESAPASKETLKQQTFQEFNFRNPLCTAACGVAEAAAIAACSALSGGVAIAACVAAAREAGNYCRSKC